MRNNKKIEEILIEKALETTIQKHYDKGLFDNYENADEVLKDFILLEVNERCRPDLDPNKDARHPLDKLDPTNGSDIQ